MKFRTRVLLYILVFISLAAILGYASTAPMSTSQAQSLVSQVQNISPTTLVIYKNNVQIALIEFAPLLGPAYGAISSYDTGLVLSATGHVPNATTTGPEAFVVTIITPIFWFEFFCYTLAVEESIAIVVAIVLSVRQRKLAPLSHEARWLVGSVLIVVMLLFVSAKLEASMINFLQ